jgi:hypothetical protein
MWEKTSTNRVSALPLGSCPDANICAADVAPVVLGGVGLGVAEVLPADSVLALAAIDMADGFEGHHTWGQKRTPIAAPLTTIIAMAVQKSKRRVKSERL